VTPIDRSSTVIAPSNAGPGACAAGDDERVVADALAVARNDEMLVRLNGCECAADVVRVEVGGDRNERDLARVGDRERLGDGHRPEVVVAFGRKQRDAHAVGGEVAEGHHGLQRRHAAAGDHDVERVRVGVGGHERRH
jgi:hypothetical protein